MNQNQNKLRVTMWRGWWKGSWCGWENLDIKKCGGRCSTRGDGKGRTVAHCRKNALMLQITIVGPSARALSQSSCNGIAVCSVTASSQFYFFFQTFTSLVTLSSVGHWVSLLHIVFFSCRIREHEYLVDVIYTVFSWLLKVYFNSFYFKLALP